MDRVNWFYRQIVTEAELDLAFTQVENAFQDAAMDSAVIGLVSGGDLVESGPPNMNVEVDAPLIATDQEGNRIYAASIDPVDISVDSSSVSTDVSGPGKEKYVSVFIQYDVILSDERIDGNSDVVYFLSSASYRIIVEQGAEANTGLASPPALKADALLLGDILRYDGQTTVETADIDLSRQQTAFKLTSSNYDLDAGTVVDAVDGLLHIMSDHVAPAAVGAHLAGNIAFDPTGTNYDPVFENVQSALEAAHVLAAPYPGNLITSPDRRRTHGDNGDWRDDAGIQYFTFAGSGVVPGGGGVVDFEFARTAAGSGLLGFIQISADGLYTFKLTVTATVEDPADPDWSYRTKFYIGSANVAGGGTSITLHAAVVEQTAGNNAFIPITIQQVGASIYARVTGTADVAAETVRLTIQADVSFIAVP